MGLDLVVVPGENRGDRAILEVSGHASGLELLDDTGVHPVLVGEHNGGARTFLSSEGISILVHLVGYIVNVVDIRSKDLPVEPGVFELDLPLGDLGKLVGDSVASHKLDHPESRHASNKFLGAGSIGVEEVKVGLGETALVQKSYKVLHDNGDLGIGLCDELISGKETAHDVEDGDLKWEVEGSNVHARAKWPSVTLTLLTFMVSRDMEASHGESWAVGSEVLEEFFGNDYLSSSLSVTFGGNPLDKLGEEVFNLLVVKGHGRIKEYFSVFLISVNIFEGVVEPGLGAAHETVPELVKLRLLVSKRSLEELLPVHRVNDALVVLYTLPHSTHAVLKSVWVGLTQGIGVELHPVVRDISPSEGSFCEVS